MATIAYQELKSCLDSHLPKHVSVKVKLKSAFSDSIIGDDSQERKMSPSILSPPSTEQHRPYYPSQYRRSIEQKKLDLCTEFLGSESGADLMVSDLSELSVTTKRCSSSRGVAPPLAPMSLAPPSPPLHIVAHRTNGRLIMKATVAPQLRVERTEGRTKVSKDFEARNGVVAADGVGGSGDVCESNDGNGMEDVAAAARDYGRNGRCKSGARGDGNLLSPESYLVASS